MALTDGPLCVSPPHTAREEADVGDRGLGERAGPRVPGERAEVHAVRGGAVGVAPRRQGERETRAGE